MEANTSSSTINSPVFFGSAALILALVIYSVAFPQSAQTLFGAVQAWIIANLSWLYILAVAIILLMVVMLALSRYGDIKLGPDHSEPDYSSLTWFAMLFSAGMGIGLMFFGVAEPVMHFLSPPVGEGGTTEAAREAMKITFFHWGLHAWGIYAIVAMILAYFSFRQGLPLTLRSALYPLIGERIHGPIGHAVDIFAIIGTVLGVATSLGLGVTQINTGLNHLYGVPISIPVQIARNGLRAVAFGGGTSGLLELRYLAANAEIVNGDRLVTSGIDGVYPPGLPVATVTRVERDATNVFARVLCQPAAGVDRGRIVLLLTPVEAPASPQQAEGAAEKGRDKPATKNRRQRSKDSRAP